MRRHQKTLERMNRRVNELIEEFDDFVEFFDESSIFSAPPLYFHQRVIEILRREGLSQTFKSDHFFEYLYAR